MARGDEAKDGDASNSAAVDDAKQSKSFAKDLVLAEVTAKFEKRTRVYKDYRHPHDLEKVLTVFQKPTDKVTTADGAVDEELLKHLRRLTAPLKERYGSLATSSMTYGAFPSSEGGNLEARRFARVSTDITRNPANFARIEPKKQQKEDNK